MTRSSSSSSVVVHARGPVAVLVRGIVNCVQAMLEGLVVLFFWGSASEARELVVRRLDGLADL